MQLITLSGHRYLFRSGELPAACLKLLPLDLLFQPSCNSSPFKIFLFFALVRCFQAMSLMFSSTCNEEFRINASLRFLHSL